MAFGYLKDPLFVACFSAYWINRLLESYGMSTQTLRFYLNDLICIPFWIPIVLLCHRKLGLRQHDDAPHAYEIVIPLLIWAVVFEVVLPATHVWSGLAVADPYDVLCYAVGALVAIRFWTCWYSAAVIEPTDVNPHPESVNVAGWRAGNRVAGRAKLPLSRARK